MKTSAYSYNGALNIYSNQNTWKHSTAHSRANDVYYVVYYIVKFIT